MLLSLAAMISKQLNVRIDMTIHSRLDFRKFSVCVALIHKFPIRLNEIEFCIFFDMPNSSPSDSESPDDGTVGHLRKAADTSNLL